jgi:hypothetical protein
MSALLEWVVIGAGPAGIAGIGKLLDAGISPDKILWIDPTFTVGDFGTAWRYVGSNTPVEGFLKFYRRCPSFGYPGTFMIDKISQEKNCPLMLAAEPLRWITQHLRESVKTLEDTVTQLKPTAQGWQLELAAHSPLETKKVLLAIGGEPKTLDFPGIDTLPLAIALDPSKLEKALKSDDVVAVFGAAQSAKSVVTNLANAKTKKNMLFYRSEASLQRHLDDDHMEHIQPLKMTPKQLLTTMPHCTKIIYAIGFERRHIPIAGLPQDYGYDQHTGEIAPGIFGLGMAFPNIMQHELGRAEYRVAAIWPVMKRLEKILPMWLQ